MDQVPCRTYRVFIHGYAKAVSFLTPASVSIDPLAPGSQMLGPRFGIRGIATADGASFFG